MDENNWNVTLLQYLLYFYKYTSRIGINNDAISSLCHFPNKLENYYLTLRNNDKNCRRLAKLPRKVLHQFRCWARAMWVKYCPNFLSLCVYVQSLYISWRGDHLVTPRHSVNTGVTSRPIILRIQYSHRILEAINLEIFSRSNLFTYMQYWRKV